VRDKSETAKQRVEREQKKTEALEVRLSHEDKQAFMERCRAVGDTASGVLRQAISIYLKKGHLRSNRRDMMMILGGMVSGTLISSVMFLSLTSIENINPLAAQYFTRLDTDQNGKLSLSEYLDPVSAYTYNTVPNEAPGNTHISVVANFVEEIWDENDPKSKDLINDRIDTAIKEINHPVCTKKLTELAKAQQSIEFYALDQDQDNHLSPKELENTRLLPSKTALQKEFNSLDADRSGGIVMGELVHAANMNPKETPDNNDPLVRPSIHTIEGPRECQNDSGSVKLVLKLDRITADFQAWYHKGIIHSVFKELNSDGDDFISFDEFVRWYL